MRRLQQRRHTSGCGRRPKTLTLIGDLSRIVDILNVDIASEEEATGATDHAQPEYPMIARALRARRENLLATISALRQQLSALSEPTASRLAPGVRFGLDVPTLVPTKGNTPQTGDAGEKDPERDDQQGDLQP